MPLPASARSVLLRVASALRRAGAALALAQAVGPLPGWRVAALAPPVPYPAASSARLTVYTASVESDQ